MCAASRNFRPPYFTKGILRLPSSTSSTSLWLALRNSTAWRLSGHVGLATPQDFLADVLGLGLQLIHGHDARTGTLAADRQQVFAMLARRIRHQCVGHIEHLLGRAVVLRQRDDLRARREAIGEAQDVFHRGGAKRVDRLRIVADHRESRAIGSQSAQDLRLQLVGVLVFIDQHVVEVRADMLREARLGHHAVPVQQQVIVVEQRGALLLLDIAAKQRRVSSSCHCAHHGKCRSSVSLSDAQVLTRCE